MTVRPPALEPLLGPLRALGVEGWAVGGGVRDALMGLPVTDLDLAVDGDAAATARRLAAAHGADRFPLSRAFGAWRVQGGTLRCQVDLTPLQGDSLLDDLARRDLTVNALAVPLAPDAALIDAHGGIADLQARRARAVGDRAFADDPVRLLRLVRIAEQIGLTIDAGTVALARRDAPLLWRSSPERLADEIGRILALPRPDAAFARMDELGLLEVLAPELGECRGCDQSEYHHKDVLGHTLEVVEHARRIADDPEPVFRRRAGRVREVLGAPLADELTAREGLMMTALLHDMAKPATRAVTAEGRVTFIGHDRRGAEMADALLLRLRTATRWREFVVRGIRHHLPLGFLVHRQPLSLRQIDRYLRLTAPSQAEIIVLTVADRLATRGPRTSRSAIERHLVLAREVMDVHFTLADRPAQRPLLGGDDVARALGREPGPGLAPLLDALREGQTVGVLRTREQALRFVRCWRG